MRLAYLSTDPGVPWGATKGASVHLAEVVAALAAEGAEVLALVAGAAGDLPAPERGVTVEVLPGPGKGSTVSERLRHQPRLREWLSDRLRTFGADCVYERLALHSAAGALAARRLGLPFLVELNAPLPEEAAAYRRLEHRDAADGLERTTLRAADLVFAVSPPLAHYATSRGARRVEVLPNAVDVDRFQPRTRSGRREPLAVFAGSLRPWHGLATLAAAWRLLDGSAPRLLVVGDGPGRAIVEEIGAMITGAVPHERIPELLAGADIGLVPYDADAPRYFSPLKLFECLAAGLATVTGALPGINAVLSPGAAVVVPPGDAHALAGAVADLAADPERRERLGRLGRELVAARHTWAHRAGRILSAAQELPFRAFAVR